MSETRLRNLDLHMVLVDHLQKNKGDSPYIYQNGIDKDSFQHDMVYWDFKDLTRRTTSNKILRDKAFNVTENQKYDRYQRGLVSMVYNVF